MSAINDAKQVLGNELLLEGENLGDYSHAISNLKELGFKRKKYRLNGIELSKDDVHIICDIHDIDLTDWSIFVMLGAPKV